MVMTTTKMIEFLKKYEFGASGRPRVISLSVNGCFMPEPDISLNSTGDGIAGAEICISTDGKIYSLDDDEIDKGKETINVKMLKGEV